MCPIYAVLAPLARPLAVPVILWFTHWRTSRLLRLAERVSSAVATVERRSFPFASAKVHAIGHGIDLADFNCAQRPERDGLELLSLAGPHLRRDWRRSSAESRRCRRPGSSTTGRR